MTQGQLATALGKSEDTVWRLETGRTKLTIEVMYAIAQILGVTPADLLPHSLMSDIVADVEVASLESVVDPVLKTLLAQGYALYKVITDAVIEIGIKPGSQIVAKQTNRAQTGDCVVCQVARPVDGRQTLLLRQYLSPSLITTNRMHGNIVFNMAEGSLDVSIVGVVLPVNR